MPKRHFYATSSDLLSRLERLEKTVGIRYVEAGNSPIPDPMVFGRGSDLPGIGISEHESGVGGRAYLILSVGTPLKVRPIALQDGGVSYAVDQLWNPDSVVLQPGGLHKSGAFIFGTVSSTCASDEAEKLLKLVSAEVTKGFVRVKSYWLGPEANLLFKQGGRFVTASASSPAAYDLHND